jgi:hypothetical protein
MAEKKAFVLRVNPEMLKELETWAQQDFRSLNVCSVKQLKNRDEPKAKVRQQILNKM